MNTVQRRLNNLSTYYSEHGAPATLRFAKCKLRSAIARSDLGWSLCYQRNPFVQTGTAAEYSQKSAAVFKQLKAVAGLQCEQREIDPRQFSAYVSRAGYEDRGLYYQGGLSGNQAHRTEKMLQHFLSFELTRPTADDVFIDVASNTSPVKDIVRELYQSESYSMDLFYEPGIHGDRIGANAAATGLPDNFASIMTLHCSFEHFAMGSDIGFIREAGRVLRPGGRVCIIPFYLFDRYCVRQDPTLEVELDTVDLEGAERVFVKDYFVDFARFYSVAQFKSRILANVGELKATVVYFSNVDRIGKGECYSHFALLLEKPGD